MKRSAHILVFPLLAALIVGCGGKTVPIVGGWYDPANEFTAFFDEGGLFWATEGPVALKGQWKFDGHKAVITDFTVDGKSSDKLYQDDVDKLVGTGHAAEIAILKKVYFPEYELSADGKTLSYLNGISKKPSTMVRLVMKS